MFLSICLERISELSVWVGEISGRALSASIEAVEDEAGRRGGHGRAHRPEKTKHIYQPLRFSHHRTTKISTTRVVFC